LIYCEIWFGSSGDRHPPVQLAERPNPANNRDGGVGSINYNIEFKDQKYYFTRNENVWGRVRHSDYGHSNSRHSQKSCAIHKTTTMSRKKHEREYRATPLQHDNVDHDQNTKSTCIIYYYIIFTWLSHEKLKQQYNILHTMIFW